MGTPEPEAPATHVSGAFRARAFRAKAHQTLLDYVERSFGFGILTDSTTQRLLGAPGEPTSATVPLSEVIGSWRLFDWIPSGGTKSIAAEWLEDVPVGTQVDPDTLKTIQSASSRALSFYQVQAVDRGRGLVVRNLLADEETFVVDAAASEVTPRWAIVLARLVEFQTLTCFETLASSALPPRMAELIGRAVEVAVGAPLPLSTSQLRSCSLDLIEVYAQALREAERGTRPSSPPKTNDDGVLVWPDLVLPGLDGLTPRQAIATPDGRTRVEALLRELEFRAHGSAFDSGTFDEVRKVLGIAAD